MICVLKKSLIQISFKHLDDNSTWTNHTSHEPPIAVAHTSFTMRGATEVTLQHHQILPLPRKMTLMIDPRYITYETSFTMRGATEVALQHHQIILLLPRKMTLMIDPRHIWSVIYNALSSRGYPPTSPNAAPATKNDSHDWSSAHMKRHLQCAEQPRLPSNITK